MPVRHIPHAIAELYYLSVYAACSVAGPFVQLPHVREGDRRPVLLVPGFLGRGLCFYRLHRRLAAQGHPTYTLDLGFQVGCLVEKARELERFIDEHALEDFYLVGHSMGGFIALGMREAARARVRHFITLGTAYHGAVLSHAVPLSRAARQLRPGSPTLAPLREGARTLENLTNVVAEWDEIAFPTRACKLGGDRELPAPPGHAQLIMGAPALDLVCDLLDELERA